MSSIEAIVMSPYSNATQSAFDWGRLTWFADRSLGNATEFTVGRCVLAPGRSNPRHYHPNCSEVLIVLEGHIRHTAAEDSETEMSPGDTVSIPPNVWHRATNIGSGEAVLLIVFSSAERQTVGE